MDIKSNNENYTSILGLNKDQYAAYKELIAFIDAPYDIKDYKRALIGAAGTGKTYLLEKIIRNCKYSFSVIGLAAPTHKAVRVLSDSIRNVLSVHTLQSDLGLRLNFDVDKFDINNPPFDPKGKVKIKNYRLYIIDEASMINRDLCMFLEKICKENQCKIIYVGDNSQLSPVGESYSPCFRGVKSFKLNTIVRQEDDNSAKKLLSILREDIKNKTFNFLNYITRNTEEWDDANTKGYKVCNDEEFNKLVIVNFSDEQIVNNVDFAKIIAYTNNKVSYWNKYVRNIIISQSEKAIINKNDLIISYTTLVNDFNEAILKNSEEYIIDDIVNYVHPKYKLKGFMVKFIAIHGGKVTSPLFVIDHSDMQTINLYAKTSNDLIDIAKHANHSSRAARWRDYYAFKEECLLLSNIIKKDGTILFSRDLDYGFAITSHKSQGSTFDTALVDVDDIVFDKYGRPYTDIEEMHRRLYVACSRCRNKLYLKYTYNGK